MLQNIHYTVLKSLQNCVGNEVIYCKFLILHEYSFRNPTILYSYCKNNKLG